MNLWDSIQVSIEGLLANKMRSILTMLGVIIGVGAVITMLGLASGMKAQMMTRIQGMGTNVLVIQSGQSRQGPVFGGQGSTQNLTLDDADAVAAKCPSVVRTAPETRSNAQVKYEDQNTNTSIMGVTADYPEVRDYSVADGRFFTDRDVRSSAKVAVIAPTTAQTLFGDASPVGKMISIKGTRFEIVGLTVAKGTSGFGDQDDLIFIPITTAMNRLFGLQYVRAIGVEAKSMDLMTAATDEITTLLRKRHHLASDEDDDFTVRSQADIMEFANQTASMFTMLLGGIAGVSLLVGGIGIMNIMLVSVTERTREIGIRKAVGARSLDIQLQFLVEALVISIIGGVIGIICGIGGSYSLAKWTQIPPAVTASSMIMSFGFSAFVGIFFGFYPARKAAKLDPIEALRYE